MSKAVVTHEIKNAEDLDVSNLLELALSALNFPHERIVHYTFLIEEALTLWRSALPGEEKLTVSRSDSRTGLKFTFSLPGEKVDPLRLQLDSSDDFSMVSMVDRLLSGVGSELKYRYRGGVNQLILSLPKQNVANRLFRYNVLLLMLPLALQSLMESVATNVDTLMLGFLDSVKMSAVSLTSTFITIPKLIITSITVGAASMMAQYWGTRDRDSIDQVAGLTMIFALLSAALFALASGLFPAQIVGLYSNDPEIIASGAVYLRWIAPSFVITALYRMLFCYLQTLGGVKKAMLFSFVGCAANVLFNSIFIFGTPLTPAMGAQGAALATGLSALVQAALALWELKKAKLVKLRFRLKFTINVKEFFGHTAMIAGQMLIWIVAYNIISSAFGHMERDIVSANSVLLILSGFVLSAKAGFGKSVGLIMGSYLGKNRLDQARAYSTQVLRLGAISALLLTPVFMLIGFGIRFLPMDFTAGAISYMNTLLLAYGANIFFSFMNGVCVFGLLYAGGDARAVLIIDTIVMWCILVPLSLATIFISSLPVVLMLILLKSDEFLSFPLKLLRVRQYKWLRNMTKK